MKNETKEWLIVGGLLAGMAVYAYKRNADMSGIGRVGKMHKSLHLLQAVNNDAMRIKKEKWTKREIRVYLDDVRASYTTPLFLFNEDLLKGSTDRSGDVNKSSENLITFLKDNKDYIERNSPADGTLYQMMLFTYADLLAEILDIED